MTTQRASGQALFDDLTIGYLARAHVERARMFASDGLSVHGKFFAFVGRDGRLILKLPKEQADALRDAGDAEPVTIGQRTMREWVGVPLPEHGEGDWADLIAAAHTHVAAIAAASS